MHTSSQALPYTLENISGERGVTWNMRLTLLKPSLEYEQFNAGQLLESVGYDFSLQWVLVA